MQWQALQVLLMQCIRVLQYLNPVCICGFSQDSQSLLHCIGIRGEQADCGLGDSLQQQVASMQLLLSPTSLDELPHTAHEKSELSHIGIIVLLFLIAHTCHNYYLALVHYGHIHMA